MAKQVTQIKLLFRPAPIPAYRLVVAPVAQSMSKVLKIIRIAVVMVLAAVYIPKLCAPTLINQKTPALPRCGGFSTDYLFDHTPFDIVRILTPGRVLHVLSPLPQ